MRPFKSKALILAAAAFAVLVLLVFLQPRHQERQYKPPPQGRIHVDESKPLRDQTLTVALDGQTFEIPKMYFDISPDDPGVDQRGILLEVFWPEMRSIYELNSRAEYERLWREEHRIGWIFIEPLAFRPALDVQIANRRRHLAKEEFLGLIDGRERYAWYRGSPNGPELSDQMYFEKDEKGKIISYEACSRQGKPGFLTCQDKFIEGGLIYEIIYNEDRFLKEWRQQRQRSIDFLRSFQVPDNSNKKEDNHADTELDSVEHPGQRSDE